MNKSRRIGAIVAMATTAVGVAAMAASAPASAAALHGPEPVSGWLRPVRAHTTSSIDIYWRTDRTICDVQVQVAGSWADVDYPGHQQYASFNHNSMLRAGRTDYTTIQVSPDVNQSATARLRTVITYDNCTFHARPQVKSFVLTLPVMRNDNWPGHNFPGGPGNGGPGNGGPGHGGPGNSGPGNGGPGNGGPGNGGPGNGGQGNGGPGHHHGQAPNSSPSPSTSPSTSPSHTTTTTTPVTPPTSPSGNGHNGNGHSGNGGDGTGNSGNGNNSHGQGTHGQGDGTTTPQSPTPARR